MIRTCASLLAAAVFFAAGHARADDRADYNRRNAERYAALFQSLDRNGDGMLSSIEAHGDLNVEPHFKTMDIDRNGVVTREELARFIRQHFGIELAAAPK